jgi:hypothetical protein
MDKAVLSQLYLIAYLYKKSKGRVDVPVPGS